MRENTRDRDDGIFARNPLSINRCNDAPTTYGLTIDRQDIRWARAKSDARHTPSQKILPISCRLNLTIANAHSSDSQLTQTAIYPRYRTWGEPAEPAHPSLHVPIRRRGLTPPFMIARRARSLHRRAQPLRGPTISIGDDVGGRPESPDKKIVFAQPILDTVAYVWLSYARPKGDGRQRPHRWLPVADPPQNHARPHPILTAA